MICGKAAFRSHRETSQRSTGCSSSSSDSRQPCGDTSLNTDFSLSFIPHMPLELVALDHLEFTGLSGLEVGRRCLAANNADVLEVRNRLGIGLVDVDGEDTAAILKATLAVCDQRRINMTHTSPGETSLQLRLLRLRELMDKILEPVSGPGFGRGGWIRTYWRRGQVINASLGSGGKLALGHQRRTHWA